MSQSRDFELHLHQTGAEEGVFKVPSALDSNFTYNDTKPENFQQIGIEIEEGYSPARFHAESIAENQQSVIIFESQQQEIEMLKNKLRNRSLM